MPLLDLIDESFVVAPPAVVADRFRSPGAAERFWPGCRLSVFMDRGDEGVRWTMTGRLVGSCEVWLQAFGDGTIVHYYLRADPTRRGSDTEPIDGSGLHWRKVAAMGREETLAWKAAVNALKDALEAGRPAGEPAPQR